MQRRKRQPGQVRIIAGTWRGRRLPVPARPELRPTPDRVRETLFNWLQPLLPGAVCLDLFAGTGALGFEAASRGAARVVLVERDHEQAQWLRAQAATFGAEQTIEVHAADALVWLERSDEAFDIIFLDPPFDSDLLQPGLALLETRAMLRANGLVYIEGRRDLMPPTGWTIHKQTRAGRVVAMLIRLVKDAPAT